jgi:hypothetical protein
MTRTGLQLPLFLRGKVSGTLVFKKKLSRPS